jgi:hypothetical protein
MLEDLVCIEYVSFDPFKLQVSIRGYNRASYVKLRRLIRPFREELTVTVTSEWWLNKVRHIFVVVGFAGPNFRTPGSFPFVFGQH